MGTSNQQVVVDFLKSIKSRQTDQIMQFFDPDCVFHNIPWEPIVGIKKIKEFIQNMVNSSSELDWQVHNIAETATGSVLTERTDHFRFENKPMKVPVMGIFEIKNGKITAWRDYFDTRQVADQMPSKKATE